MAAISTINIQTENGTDPLGRGALSGGTNIRAKLRMLVSLLKNLPARTVVRVGTAQATGTLTLEDGVATGTVGGIINGVTITVTYATSITATAAAIAAAINASANALVTGLVTATSALGVVTVTAARKGKGGNCITLAATGTGVTASAARLTGGTETSATL